MNHKPFFLEIGNTTMKLAQRVDGAFQVMRCETPEEIIRVVLDTVAPIVCAPAGQALSDILLPQLPADRTLVITRESLRFFVGDSYDTPETLGLDRILNLLGLEGEGVAVSCGTAITVDVLVHGRPVWGAILPGFRTAAEGLYQRVPALPHIEPDDVVRMPARTSHDSVANGVLLGTALATWGIIQYISVIAGLSTPRIVLTGGDAPLLHKLLDDENVEVDDGLLFRGMQQWYQIHH